MSASRSARPRFEARFFFEPGQLGRQPANLAVQLVQLALMLGFERALV